jgi:hypothetical protein
VPPASGNRPPAWTVHSARKSGSRAPFARVGARAAAPPCDIKSRPRERAIQRLRDAILLESDRRP